MQTLYDDLRDAVRSLRKQPRFLIVASLTLALGIGAVTATFSVVNGVLLSPLPYPRPGRLVNIWSTAPGLGYDQFPLSPDLFLFYRRHSAVFEDMALYQSTRVSLTGSGSPEVLDGAATTHSYFSTLGADFTHGRPYSADEDRPEAQRVLVVSHRLWTRRFGTDPALVGRTIRINGEPALVVGIAPSMMDQQDSPDVWMPARFNEANPPTGNFGWNAIGRLKEGVRPDQAATHLEPLVQRAMSEYIQSPNYRAFLTDGRYRPIVNSMKEDLIGSVREPLWILLGTVGMVLLIACGNVANLCLVRAESRQREIAIRAAIGCSRGGLIRMLLAESIVLSAVGTACGVLFAAVALPILVRLAPETIPRLDQIRMDALVLMFAACAAILSALLFGLFPAFRYTRSNLLPALQGGRSATDQPARQRGRQLLVVAQTAMALVLLVGSGLLARSFARIMGAEHGFLAQDVLTFRVALPQAAYPQPGQIVPFTAQLVDRLSELPEIESAGAGTAVPLAASPSGTTFEFAGHPVEAGRLPPIVLYSSVTPGYFRTLRMPILRGNDFDSGDLRDGVYTVIVNRAAAERYWPGEDAVGKRLRTASSTDPESQPWFTVKGIVGDVRHQNLREPPAPQIYFPLNPRAGGAPRVFSYLLRGPRLDARADAIRQAVWSLNPDLPVAALRTMDDIVGQSVVEFTFTMLTLAIAAGVALALGAVGLYGVLSYAVSLRRREIGVRIALGAPPSRVKRAVMTNAALILGVGLVMGALGAAGLTRFLGGMLYETTPLDASTFGGMSALLFAVGLIAAYLPARKAASVSPLEAMKIE
ncbi:MAG TPA: ABC transporter permease [Vicinamibacterales bacterium]|nr:ABC transporter permease [Vicinamibacterales bacterium]